MPKPLETGKPPTSDGRPAVRLVQVSADYAGQRLDNFLLRELKGVPKSHVYRVVRAGEVRVNKGRASADTRLATGDLVRIPPLRLPEKSATPVPAREYAIVFEDDTLAIVDKPAGVAVHGGSGVSFGVIESLRRARPQTEFLELVHRLDKDTSGLLMVAKKRSALLALQDALRTRSADKRYLALVLGHFEGAHKTVDAPLLKLTGALGERQVRVSDSDDARAAKTVFRLVRRYRWEAQEFTLLEAQIKTGRTHQIRVHLQHLGLPIVGDERYGDFEANKRIAKDLKFRRMFLHAALLVVPHAGSDAPLRVASPLPAECAALLARLTPL